VPFLLLLKSGFLTRREIGGQLLRMIMAILLPLDGMERGANRERLSLEILLCAVAHS